MKGQDQYVEMSQLGRLEESCLLKPEKKEGQLIKKSKNDEWWQLNRASVNSGLRTYT